MEEPNERMLDGRTYGTAMGTVRWDWFAEGLGCRPRRDGVQALTR